MGRGVCERGCEGRGRGGGEVMAIFGAAAVAVEMDEVVGER